MIYVPYVLLMTAILFALFGRRRAPWIALCAAVVSGLWPGALGWFAPLSLGSLGVALFALARGPNALVRTIGGALSLGLSIALSNYWLPGFRNLPIFQDARFAADSIPFTMYLNFDKTSAGLLLFLFWIRPRARPWTAMSLRLTAVTLVTLVLLMLPLAYAVHYVRFDPKWPALGWVWMLNNFFFVCLAEEGLFRGFIQRGLREWRFPAWAAILVAASLFGLAHWKGGLVYVALAFVAGLFYGFAFDRTGRLEAGMVVHFGLNLTHFLLFSYPALAPPA